MQQDVKTSPAPLSAAQSIGPLLLAGVGMRLFMDTGNQLFNPFLSVFADGLGASTVALGILVSVRSLSGLVGPVLGAWSDRVGYLRTMRLALFLTAVGLAAFGLSSSLIAAALAMVPMGIGLATFTPAIQAYLSTRLPYERRARGLGILEYSWALAGILGLSLAGILIESYGWRAPFFVLSALLCLAVVMTLRFGSPRPSSPRPPVQANTLRDFFRLGRASQSAWASIAVTGLTFFGMMNVIIIHSEWLRTAFSLGARELGLVALLLGLCDLAGSVLVSAVADHVGKRRMVLLGSASCLLGYLLLPYLSLTLATTLLGLGIVRFLMQIAYVSNIPLLSEQAPQHRGKVMALAMAAGQLGLVLAGITGPWLYLHLGVSGLGTVSAGAMVLTVFIIFRWIQEIPDRTSTPDTKERT